MKKIIVFLAISTALCTIAIAQTQESFGGLGMSVRVSERGVNVAGVLPNSPASIAGLQIGDVIISAGGTVLSSVKPERQVALLRGKEGTMANLVVERNGKQIAISAKRTEITVQPLEAEIISSWYGKKENLSAEEINFLASQKTAEGYEALGVVQNGLPISKNAENLNNKAIQQVAVKKIEEKVEDKPVINTSSLNFVTKENISFSLVKSDNVNLFLINAKGEIVWKQRLEKLPAGVNTINWNTANLPNGFYNLRIEVGNSIYGYKVDLL